MDPATVILVTLVVYKLVLLGIGWRVSARNQTSADYFLGGRKLGPLVAAISASASSSSVWTLLGVSGYAFQNGLAAIWFLPACIGGFAINWFLIAPRLQRDSGEAITITEFLAGPPGPRGRRLFVWAASIGVLLALLLYVSAQISGAEKTFTTNFPELNGTTSVVIGGVVVLIYTMLGGFWAVSITDTIQGLLMAVTAVILPIAGVIAVGGPGELWAGMAAEGMPEHFRDLFGGGSGAAAFGVVVGILGIGIGYPGQPHVVNRFMALSGAGAVRRARNYAMAWAILVYVGMVVLGWCGQLLLEGGTDPEAMFFVLALDLLPAVVAGVMVAAILSAIMSTADSQLLVAGSVVAHDLGWEGRTPRQQVFRARLVVSLLTAGAIAAALLLPESIFDKVLSAWACLGSGFGPLLLVTLWRGRPEPTGALAAFLVGYLGSLAAYLYTGSGAHWSVTVVPWAASLAIASLAPKATGSTPSANSSF